MSNSYTYSYEKTKKVTKMEEKKEGKTRLFWPDYCERHEEAIEKKIRKFILAYKLLDEFLLMGTNPNDEESLQFYSNLYVENAPILTEITCYVISNGYSGKRKRIDNAILLSQKIMGLLKVLHKRYVISITSPDPIGDQRWYEISKKSNAEIVEEMILFFKRMYSFPNEN